MSLANKKQPEPIPNQEVETWEEVIKDYVQYVSTDDSLKNKLVDIMKERNEFGRKKYKTAIQPFNGRNNIEDAFQELLDASVYLKNALIEDPNSEGLKELYLYSLDLLDFIHIYINKKNKKKGDKTE